MDNGILTQGLHLTVGAINGLAYPMLRQRLNLPPAIAGPLFGLVVYTVNVVGMGSILVYQKTPTDR